MTTILESAMVGAGLAMDAFGVALAMGAAGRKKFDWKKIVLTAGMFGVFQAVMPLIGWFGCSLCQDLVMKLGRITAASLLALIGVQMIFEGFSKKDPAKKIGIFSYKRLVILAFATSIDALLTGISYACLNRTNITCNVAVIGLVTAAIAAAGCITGRTFGNKFGSRCTIPGGLVLLGIAIKILAVD